MKRISKTVEACVLYLWEETKYIFHLFQSRQYPSVVYQLVHTPPQPLHTLVLSILP